MTTKTYETDWIENDLLPDSLRITEITIEGITHKVEGGWLKYVDNKDKDA